MVKRLFDILCASIGLLLVAPLFAVVAILIKRDSSGPVFFRQTRVGQFGRPFNIYKFRTMCQDAEKKGAQVSSGDDPRITRLGRFLRKYKIDELPQLINVLFGEMSFVGPRPEVPRYVEVFKKDYEEILKIKPGITDYASLEFKDENELLKAAEYPENKYINDILPVKIGYYKKYLLEQSLSTDIKVIFLTLLAIFRRN
jgi:lipopolysaccharide/colanic/teichoic acid biosynthesis glycosyltransferase